MLIVKPNQAGLKQAVKILKAGGVIIYPTDTAYALGGVFDSRTVVKKILEIKKRRDPKFTLVSSSLNQVKKFFKLSETKIKFARKFWPAPLSIIVSPKYAVRVPDHKLARDLASRSGKPLIATSANLSGQATLYDSAAIIKAFNKKSPNFQGEKPDLLIDAGKLRRIKTSTIVKVTANKIQTIREGSVTI